MCDILLLFFILFYFIFLFFLKFFCVFLVDAIVCLYDCIQLYCSCCHYGVIKHDDDCETINGYYE